MDSSSSSSLDSHRAAYSPSAPPVPDPDQEPRLAHPYYPSRSSQDQYYRPPASSSSSSSYTGHTYHQSQYPTLTPTGSFSSNYGSGHSSHSDPGYGYGYPPPQPQQQQQYQSYNYNASFPPGTDPGVIRTFQMVDRDGSGFIEESELRQALSSGYQRFSMRTIRLLIFLFKNPSDSALKIGPKEFSALWSCLGQWRAIFERFDRDRSGKIDATELRDALNGIGYAVPPSVFQVLISRYEEGNGRRVELSFDSFVECGMIVKGLTEKFKEKDPRYTGSATMTYDSFMSMIIPFLVSY
ncbi:probable calcium-binding protein CML48 [Coffea eugenioides]|uniref:probable calcium-binding protein CML48 n=1 Tax=Coffea eugenioides TaxID=49369 RepID=UPI000F606D0E|nr:probable calcium-binding protein CML48 [Coffea eugenioides]